MPATDYSKTIIYVIKCKDDNITEEYVGSTTNFRNRKWTHKSNCYNKDDNHYNFKIYQFIRENGGWGNWNMIQLEEFPCENKRQAECREEEVKVERKAQLNMRKAFATLEERKEEKRKHFENWRKQNKEYHKMWEKAHKEKRKEQKKLYYKENKTKKDEYQKQYLQKKKKEKELLNNIHNEDNERSTSDKTT